MIYAFPEANLFPISTREASLESYTSFLHSLEKSSALQTVSKKIEDRLLSALISHGLEKEAAEIYRDYVENSALSKTASFLETDTLLDGSLSESVASDLDKVASTVNKSLKHLESTSQKSELSKLLLQKLAAYDSSKYEEIHTYAGVRGTDLEKAAELILFRAKRAPDPVISKGLAKLAQVVLICKEVDLEKVAQLIDTIDEELGTSRLVRRGTLPDGYHTIFNKPLLEKKAEISIGGREFHEDKLKNLPIEKWQAALGEDFIKSATINGKFSHAYAIDLATTLPLPEAKTLALYLED
jgi:hypothetical protein